MFQIGDRVIINLKGSWLHGRVGTIVSSAGSNMPGVEFDEFCGAFHDLNGCCKDGHGFWMDKETIELYDDGVEIDASSDGELLSLL